MSSILKALKKLEDDKATRRPDELRIDAEILRTESYSRHSSSGLLVVSLLLMAFGAGATYLYMKRDKPAGQSVLNSQSISSQKQPPSPDPPEIRTERLPPAIVVVPAKPGIVSAGDNAAKGPASIQKKSTPVVAARPVAVPKTAVQQTTSPAVSSSPVRTVRPVPSLRVNGIAFQDGGAGNVAMINGEPISSGAVIEGVKVEEIYKNKVRFSYNGETFEILTGQSNR